MSPRRFAFDRSKLEAREVLVDLLDVKGKCIGTEKTGTAVMVTFGTDRGNGSEFHDAFLTREQAAELREKLDRVLAQPEVM